MTSLEQPSLRLLLVHQDRIDRAIDSRFAIGALTARDDVGVGAPAPEGDSLGVLGMRRKDLEDFLSKCRLGASLAKVQLTDDTALVFCVVDARDIALFARREELADVTDEMIFEDAAVATGYCAH